MKKKYCCPLFENSIDNKIIYHSKDFDETNWFIPAGYHIYFCPFCGKYIKGKGFGRKKIRNISLISKRYCCVNFKDTLRGKIILLGNIMKFNEYRINYCPYCGFSVTNKKLIFKKDSKEKSTYLQYHFDRVSRRGGDRIPRIPEFRGIPGT